MCLAVPGRVLEVVDREACLARVDVLGTVRRVNLSLLGEVTSGDWVLVYMGFAIERMSEAAAEETVRLFDELGSALEDPAAARSEVKGS
jgi:hydrogenase expression/formation protein HypC